jgi:hypothetical protein
MEAKEIQEQGHERDQRGHRDRSGHGHGPEEHGRPVKPHRSSTQFLNPTPKRS